MAACGHSMAYRIQKLLLRTHVLKSVRVQSVRSAGKFIIPDHDHEILPSFSERLAEWNDAHNDVPDSYGVNIGLPYRSSTNKNTHLQKLRKWAKDKAYLEKAARHRELKVDLSEVNNLYAKEQKPVHIQRIAEHYGIFKDLFDGAHFNAVVPLDVWYDFDEEFVTPVCHGNVIQAKETEVQPCAEYETDENTLWTLVMSSPDANLEQNDKELLHWMVGNIPGTDIENGETLCNYLQPFPVKGAGFLRYVFVLYKQQGPIDFNKYKKSSQCYALRERSFSTVDFYRQFEDEITPAGLAFFQSEWDRSVRNTFHNVLDMPEPKFEFIHPPAHLKEQEELPHKRAFNMYLDNYRDMKDLDEEVLKHKLKDCDPLETPKQRPKYMNTERIPLSTATWYRCKIEDQRLGRFHWKQLYEEPKE